MSIASDMIRGHTDAIILAHLMEADSYGYQINKEIMRKTQNRYELKEATLYSAFRRLEQENLILSYWGNEDVGARRRYYAVTEAGRSAYKRLRQEWEHEKQIIDLLIEVGGTQHE